MANLPEPPTTNRSAREIFLRVMEADGATAREALIASTCGGDVEIRREVEDLIDQGSEVVDFLESPAAVSLREPPKVGLPTAVVQEGSGDVIGPFKLLDLLGEGGCGMVYAADQQKPVRRQVALKIIKLGMDTKSVIARFESERQALALMDHPNIAKVFDAGATENGRPYFVMELVHGVPITSFCDQQKLSTRERLQLFIQV
ncbi:MAG: serine/threonine protein kinase, partial [Verrucomicrobiales bacterium]